MKRWVLQMMLLPMLASVALPMGAVDQDVVYTKFKFGKNTFHMVIANLSSPSIAAGTVHDQSLKSPWFLIKKTEPIAAITGTFFAPGQGKAVADVLVNGKLVAKGSRGTAIGVGWDGRFDIFDQQFGQKTDWLDYQFGLRGAVRLIRNGKVQPDPKSEQFRDSRIWGRASRTAVGLTKAGKLVFVATTAKLTLSELGKAMVSQGVRDAVSLDGGGSTCLYYMGEMKVNTGRRLCNMVVINKMSVAAEHNSVTDAVPVRVAGK